MKLPVDAKTRRVVVLYEDADRRIQELIAAALDRGAEGTAAFYGRQLAEVRRALVEVQQAAVPEAAALVGHGYVEGVKYADEALGLEAAKFAGIHRQAVDVLADNMVSKLNSAATTVGRQAEDLFRQAGLRAAAEQIVTGQTRKAISEAMRRNLIRQGATAFTDRAGRRWTLGAYTKMVARTTTREAVTHGTANRLLESGHDLVTISKHSHDLDECSDYEGRTFSLTGETPGYDSLDAYPPFHPNCVHVLTPAAATFEQFEKAVGSDAVQEQAQQVEAPPIAEPPPTFVPDVGQKVFVREGFDPFNPSKKVTGKLAKVHEVKGDQAMLNAGTAKNPKWVQARLDGIEAPPVRTVIREVDELPLPTPFEREPMRSTELREHLAQDRSVLDADAKKAVKQYTGNDFFDLNKLLRRGNNPDLARRIDRAFEQVKPTTEPSLLYRGIDFSRIGRVKLEPGKVISDKAFSSTTVKRSVAEAFGKGGGRMDLLEIEAPPGSKMLDVNKIAGSQFGGESEILLPRGSRLVITNVTEKTVKGQLQRVVRARLVL